MLTDFVNATVSHYKCKLFFIYLLTGAINLFIMELESFKTKQASISEWEKEKRREMNSKKY